MKSYAIACALVCILLLIAGGELSAQDGVSESAFRGACFVSSAADQGKFGAALVRDGDEPWLVEGGARGVEEGWSRQQVKGDPHQCELHGWRLITATLESVCSPKALVYDVTGEDTTVYYRLPDDRWQAIWDQVRPLNDDPNSKREYARYEYLRVAKGKFRGWYLDFEQVGGSSGTYYRPRLVKKPTRLSQLSLSTGHSGISR